MVVFLIAATVLTVACVAMVLPALLGRARPVGGSSRELNVAVYQDRLAELRAGLEAGDLDAEEFEQAKRDLDAALLEDVPESAEDAETAQASTSPAGDGRWLAAVVAVALPLAGALAYVLVGKPEAIGVGPARASAPAGQNTQTLPSVDEMVAGLEQRLRESPDDAEGWLTLARSYMVMRRHADAAAAYGRAQALVGDVPDVLVDHAEAIALSSEERMAGRAQELAARALAIDPNHPKALWLNGFAARQRGDDERAVSLWTRLLPLLPEESEQRRVVAGLIAETSGDSRPASQPASPHAAAPAGAESPPAVAITVDVALDASLADEAAPSDTLYVFARAVDGPPMPVAIARLTVSDLPARVVLDDSLSMVPTARLSGASQVVVGARISKSGNPIPAPGDLQGVSGIIDVRPDATPVQVRIDQRLP